MEDRILIKAVRCFRNSSLYTVGEYEFHYDKGTIVKAVEGTLGIFCFDTMKNAEKFVHKRDKKGVIYKKVRAIGDIKTEEITICSCTLTSDIKRFYARLGKKLDLYTQLTPKGTVLCQEVEVLD